VGIKVEYGEPLYEGEYKGTFKTVGDKEHAEIIRLYIEEGLGINKIAGILQRLSRTPLVQIQRHNRAVERNGFCPACRRIRSKHENQNTLKKYSQTTGRDLNTISNEDNFQSILFLINSSPRIFLFPYQSAFTIFLKRVS
jgi:hypothetical protein